MKIFEAILDYVQLSEWLIQIGLSEKQSEVLLVVISTTLLYLLNMGRKKGVAHYQNSKTAKSLVHYNYSDIQKAKRYFIETKAQSLSPTIEEELKGGTKFIQKFSLIDHFMKTAFNEKKESNKFYLVLADSGMGKTTFMINLYIRYYSFWNFGRKYEIKLLPFRDNNILEDLKEIGKDKAKAKNTILLLDAFDEYKGLLPPENPDGLTNDERFRKRLYEITDLVQYYPKVVITSRSQYFPGQEKEDYTLKVPKYGSNGFHSLAKLYLSPFDEREIEEYLNKKFGRWKFWNKKKKDVARNIVAISPKLMVRPMLLSYIDYFIDANQSFENSYQVYETLIEQWLEKEAEKRKHENREKFKKDLYDFSRLAALEINRNRLNTGTFSISMEKGQEIAKNNGLDLTNYEITGQSLLTRDANHHWKFAHKSILEYFLAKEAIDNLAFYLSFDFTGMDMVKLFYEEEGKWSHIKGGTFLMGSPENEVDRNTAKETQHEVKLSDFYMSKNLITQKQWEEVMGNNPSSFKNGDDYPVESISWNDAQEFIKKLNVKFKNQYIFSLPTEAQWEYACRAGTSTPFNTGENLTTEQANYNGNYPYKQGKYYYIEKTTKVGSYPPNSFGLYDMHGNVLEWCQDWYSEKYYEECKQQGIVENPEGPESGSSRVLRGGSWYTNAQICRSSSRSYGMPDGGISLIGFRLVCSLPSTRD